MSAATNGPSSADALDWVRPHCLSQFPRRLADDVWCLTCNHKHIPNIPVVTWVCADCGFGSWDDEVAEGHATVLPDHVVHPLHHQTVPLPLGNDTAARS